jgi:propionyl-CoA carboxylase alpha chain
VHPGYGFLSENEEFSRRAGREGIIFIGPKHYSVAAMGDKIASKKLANGSQGQHHSRLQRRHRHAEQAVEIAKGIGYPVMIKASPAAAARACAWPSTTRRPSKASSSCRNEARNSFGDDRVFIEKFVEEPRHIEIQVLGDSTATPSTCTSASARSSAATRR